MQEWAERAGGVCLVFLAALSLSGPPAWADAGKGRADHLCEKALTAERDAREFERKSEERRRFLKGRDGIAVGSRPAPAAGTAAARQSAKAQIAQAQAMLAQLRQQAAASENDRNVVPGFGRWFLQLEGGINRSLQALESCLDRPESCNIPPISCPAPPAPPSFSNVGNAAFVRNVQQSYQQAANASRQACQKMNAELQREADRLRREGRGAAMPSAAPSASAEGSRFGDTDLYLVRVESLKRDAARFRLEAARLSGVPNYCGGVRPRPRIDPARARDVAEALRSAGKRRPKPDPGSRPDKTVFDLKEAWERKWNNGGPIDDPGPPLLPVISGKAGTGATGSGDDLPDEFRVTWRDRVKDGYEKAASLYREADEQVQLTEFLTPPSPKEYLKEKAKDAAGEILVKAAGPFGKSVEAAITVLGAVKESTEEIGEILEDAPRVIGSGSAADSLELADRAFRVPAKVMKSLFDDVTDEIDLPEYRYQYKKGWDEKP